MKHHYWLTCLLVGVGSLKGSILLYSFINVYEKKRLNSVIFADNNNHQYTWENLKIINIICYEISREFALEVYQTSGKNDRPIRPGIKR